MRFRRKPRSDDAPQWQPMLYAILIGLGLVVAYLIAFVVENSKKVSIHWVFATTHASLIFVVLISLGIGLVVGVLLSQLHRRRWRRGHPVAPTPENGGEPADADRDLGG